MFLIILYDDEVFPYKFIGFKLGKQYRELIVDVSLSSFRFVNFVRLSFDILFKMTRRVEDFKVSFNFISLSASWL